MSKTNSNALAGLIGSYGDSGDESDDGGKIPGSRFSAAPAFPAMPPPGMIPSVLTKTGMHSQPPPSMHQNYASGQAPPLPPNAAVFDQEAAGPTIHPAPIVHCPWSACYDEGSGFTYYWNQTTNAVTWEAPPEYLLALKLAQQQLHTSGTTEVTAAEWNLYQQALVDKQNAAKIPMKPAPVKSKKEKNSKDKNGKVHNRKRCHSDDDNEKIELITSYHNSDSESDPEPEIPVKAPEVKPPPLPPSKPLKVQHKKAKTKPMEYGPALPPKQNYTLPIGPEMPKESVDSPKAEDNKVEDESRIEDIPATVETEDSQDENSLLQRLKDKAKLLEKLGGELPSGLEKIIKDTNSGTATPIKSIDDIQASDIDDLLEEIEKKELPKSKAKKIDMFDENSQGSNESCWGSIKSGTSTPVTPKALFPSSKNIDETPALFPSAAKIEEVEIVVEKDSKTEAPPTIAVEKKGTNLYLADPSELIERPRKKLRISNSVLPERKNAEIPSYTTKYSQHIEGFSSERVGLGFSEDSDSVESTKAKTVSYGNGLTFTKGEVLNEKDESLDGLTDLVEAKLKHLNELQPGVVSPVQEMLIQMQTLRLAYAGGSLGREYWRGWSRAAAAALASHEARAAPPGWTCHFQRSAGRYRYRRADGFEQWEYPAVPDTDMDICTTPPPAFIEEDPLPPPPPPPPSSPPPPPPPPVPPPPPPPPLTPPSPPCRVHTPPPPAWHDPPPPGCDDPPPLPQPEPIKQKEIKPKPPPKQEIGDELLSFYNDIAELEKHTPGTEPTTPVTTPPPLPLPVLPTPPIVPVVPIVAPVKIERRKRESVEREATPKTDKDKDKLKKKSKLKISTSMGMKQKTVSSMVAKWQHVADEIHSD